jgi:hypothetical protein
MGLPNQGKEEIQMFNFRNLFHERWNSLSKHLRIVINDDIEVDTVFAASKERFAVISTVSKKGEMARTQKMVREKHTRPDLA